MSRVLFLTTVLPNGRTTGSEVASQAFIDCLRSFGLDVQVIGYTRKGVRYFPAEGEYSVEERAIETKGAGWSAAYWLTLAFIRGRPYSVQKYQGRAYISVLKRLFRESSYDVVVLDHVQLLLLSAHVPPGVPIVLIVHNVEQNLYMTRRAFGGASVGSWIYKREGRLIAQLERDARKCVSAIWALTPSDAAFFGSLPGQGSVIACPLVPSWERPTPAKGRRESVVRILGTWTWEANRVGLVWFLEQVVPHIGPDVRVEIGGKGSEMVNGVARHVRGVGFVASAREFLGGAKVICIPSIEGEGLQIKTLDAMFSGAKVIATTTAVRGMVDLPSCVVVSDEAEDFARNIVAALAEPTEEAGCFDEAVDWLENRKQMFSATLEGSIRAIGVSGS